jgi:hypothetical protein
MVPSGDKKLFYYPWGAGKIWKKIELNFLRASLLSLRQITFQGPTPSR